MTIKNDDQNTSTEPTASEADSAEAKPRKLLLGKRVLRHFSVRSSLQTGMKAGDVEPTGGPTPPGDPVGNTCVFRPG